MTAVQIEALEKVYGTVHALDGLNLKVEEGSVFGFLGPNGAGKTTTIRILTGLARATSGRVWVAGQEIGSDGLDVRRKIGYLPEEPAFYPWMSPIEYLDYVGSIFGLSRTDRAARTRELLGMAGLTDVGKRKIGGFSRGMRQRLGLAQALVNRPEVLFLDEPVSALDPAGRKDVLELIEGLSKQCTVFMSTHILADVERVCDTIGILAHGRLVIEAPREDLLAQYVAPVFELEAPNGSSAGLARWVEDIRRAPWVVSAGIEGHVARVTVRDVDAARRELLSTVIQAGLEIDRYQVLKPSLEDVFLRLVQEEEKQQ